MHSFLAGGVEEHFVVGQIAVDRIDAVPEVVQSDVLFKQFEMRLIIAEFLLILKLFNKSLMIISSLDIVHPILWSDSKTVLFELFRLM